MILGLSADEAARLRVAALSWIGTPFHPKASVKNVGVGCIELVVASYVEADLLPTFHLGYPWGFWQNRADDEFFAALMSYFRVVPPPWEIGDALTFRKKPWPGTGHTALYVGGGDVVHAVAGRKVQRWPVARTILDQTLSEGWRRLRG